MRSKNWFGENGKDSIFTHRLAAWVRVSWIGKFVIISAGLAPPIEK
jgi:hypothetical protein